jgi:hypothetical protein
MAWATDVLFVDNIMCQEKDGHVILTTPVAQTIFLLTHNINNISSSGHLSPDT